MMELACKDASKAFAERTTVLDESTDELRLMVERQFRTAQVPASAGAS